MDKLFGVYEALEWCLKQAESRLGCGIYEASGNLAMPQSETWGCFGCDGEKTIYAPFHKPKDFPHEANCKYIAAKEMLHRYKHPEASHVSDGIFFNGHHCRHCGLKYEPTPGGIHYCKGFPIKEPYTTPEQVDALFKAIKESEKCQECGLTIAECNAKALEKHALKESGTILCATCNNPMPQTVVPAAEAWCSDLCYQNRKVK